MRKKNNEKMLFQNGVFVSENSEINYLLKDNLKIIKAFLEVNEDNQIKS